MPPTPPIVCRPTHWFILRACAILLMFTVFAVLFYIDGSTGYRAKNEVFYLYQTFEGAGRQFADMNADQSLTAEEWEMHAKKQSVHFPEDATLLPEGITQPMPWPTILQSHKQMKSKQWNQLWLDYSASRGFPASPPEQPYDARKIREQWIVFYICLSLAAITVFFMLRTMRRSIRADHQALTCQNGKRIPYSDIHRLDLRKWDTKGIAFIDYDGASGSGRVRIDGLTYGGFKKERGEPAEKLIQLLQTKFSGELLEYTTHIGKEEDPEASKPADN